MDRVTKFRACPLCEAICGLELRFDDGKLAAIRGDDADPFSRGHICPKGNAILDAHASKASKDAKAKAAAEAAANKGEAPATPEQKQKQWWSSATSLSTADQAPKEDPHIRCRIEKDERFMRRSDCLSQGGKLL